MSQFGERFVEIPPSGFEMMVHIEYSNQSFVNTSYLLTGSSSGYIRDNPLYFGQLPSYLYGLLISIFGAFLTPSQVYNEECVETHPCIHETKTGPEQPSGRLS